MIFPQKFPPIKQGEFEDSKRQPLYKEQYNSAKTNANTIKKRLVAIDSMEMSADDKEAYRQKLNGLLQIINEGIAAYENKYPQ